jgi:hypothetical protein
MFVSLDAMIGKDFESGLTNLKQVAEAEPASPPMPAASSAGNEKAAPTKP